MFPLVEKFKRTGVTQQTFSEKKKIAYGMFLSWLKKYNDSKKTEASGTNG